MAKKASQRLRTRVEQNTFVKGLITEANPLTYPENASLDEENFVLNRDGSRQRRFGMDYEEGDVKRSIPFSEGTDRDIETFLWRNAGSKQNTDIAVIKIKDVFWFFDNNADKVSTAPLNVASSVTIAGFDPTGANNPSIYSYAHINGEMVVASGMQTVTFLSYDEGSDTVFDRQETISIRDTFGIYEDRPIEDRPIFTSTQGVAPDLSFYFDDYHNSGIHLYNLINKGWKDSFNCLKGDPTKLLVKNGDPLAVTYFTAIDGFSARLPSLSDILFNNLVSGESNPDFNETYRPYLLEKEVRTRSEAVNGAVIFDNMFVRGAVRNSLVRGRSGNTVGTGEVASGYQNAIGTADLISPMSEEGTNGGISSVLSFNGRLIYTVYENGLNSGDKQSPSFGSMLFYSQASYGTEDLTKCFTEIDPTNTEDFTLLDTDGGYISISDIGSTVTTENLGGSLFVFADNGIWQINGGDSTFTASNININRVTNIGSISKKSIAVAGNRLFYLTDSGLFELVLNEVDPSLPASIVNLSQITIQGFFDALPDTSKKNTVARYDVYANTVSWLFASEYLPDEGYFDTELTLDLNLGAFSVNKIKTIDNITGEGSPYVVGYLDRPSAIYVENELNVVVDIVDSVDVNGESVHITFRDVDSSILSSNKYWVLSKLTASTANISVAEYRDLQFRDWGSIQNTVSEYGTDANAFLLTGYLTGGDSSINKRITYITSHFRRTERILSPVSEGFEPDNPSSCSLTAQWEWTRSVNSGRWSRLQEIYRLPRTFIPDTGDFDYGFEVVTTKTKLRGKGKALSLLFQTKPLHDCHLYGWSYEINTEVSV